jgi:hypothetical protein
LRDKFVSFVIPVVVISGILGGIVWLLMTTYFWDTARLTVLLPTDKETTVRLDIQARILYSDFVFLGIPYSFHITLPWSLTQTCIQTCVLDRLPGGDAALTLLGDESTRESLFIAPDTKGTLDLTPALVITPVTDLKKIKLLAPIPLSDIEREKMDVLFTNTLQNVSLVTSKGTLSLFDHNTHQIFPLPVDIQAQEVGKTDKEGVYMFYDVQKGMMFYDRYGRQPTAETKDFPY